jgi:hypothetical protein
MPVVAGSAGYESVFEVHLDNVSVTSSLNDIRLIYAESLRVSLFNIYISLRLSAFTDFFSGAWRSSISAEMG